MTGFEQATLTLQHVALWISAVAAAANVIAAAGIWHGIRAMVRANKDRAVILDRQREADDKRHKEAMNEIAARRKADDKRHEDAMAAHAEAMAEGARRHAEAMAEGARRHEEALKEGARRHEDAMAAHAEAMAEGARRHEEAMKEGARRHEEAMKEIAARREADERRHEEAMAAHAAQGRSLDALIGGLERQIVSLESVVERTGPLRMGFEEPDPGPAE